MMNHQEGEQHREQDDEEEETLLVSVALTEVARDGRPSIKATAEKAWGATEGSFFMTVNCGE